MKKKRIIIIGIIIILLIVGIISVILLLKKDKNKELVYLSNGRLYFYNKKDNKELGRGELSSVVFSQKDHSIFLYKIENDLYLHNKKEEKIIENAKDYNFVEDKIVVIDINNKLNIYDKELKEIEEKIDKFVGVSENLVLYIKDLALISYNAKDDKKETIDDKVYATHLTEDKKSVVYLKDTTLTKYDLTSNKEVELVKEVGLYNCDESCNKLYYLNRDNKLFYYDGKESEEIAKKVMMIQKYDFKNNYIIYTKEGNKNYIYLTSKGEEKELSDITLPKDLKVSKENIYYQSFDGTIYTINTKSLDIEKFKENSFDNIHLTKNGFVYSAFEDEKNILYIDDKKIAEDIIPSSTVVDEKNDIIYYLKKEDEQNHLYRYSKDKEELIDKNIYKYYALDNKEVYYIKDYKLTKEYGDLYKYKKKTEKVLEKVNDIIGFENLIENK